MGEKKESPVVQSSNQCYSVLTTFSTHFQIFEWCNYMRLSGRLPAEPKLDRILSTSRNGVLTTSQVSQLDKVYREKIERYSSLITEYECEKRKAVTNRCFNSFLTPARWEPPTRSLSDTERDLIKGPTKQVIFFKKVSIRNECTGRLMEYSASDSEIDEVRTRSSYVAMLEQNTTFARIKSLFSHSFSNTDFNWAIVEVFKSAAFDYESRMWSVPLTGIANVQCTLLTTLSDPLVVAVEKSTKKLWFLNF